MSDLIVITLKKVDFVGLEGGEITIGKQKDLTIILVGNNILSTVEIVGSRRQNRTAVGSVVPVDIIDVSHMASTFGQPDVNSMLQEMAPSFNSNKQLHRCILTQPLRILLQISVLIK